MSLIFMLGLSLSSKAQDYSQKEKTGEQKALFEPGEILPVTVVSIKKETL